MLFEDGIKKFYVCVSHQFGYFADFFIRIGNKPSAVFHPLLLQIIYKGISGVLLEFLREIRQAKV